MSEFERLQNALHGRFVIDRVLARGGMAIVYLATELHPKRTVALKVFDPAVSARVNEDRFRQEIALVSGLTHPCIVPILAAGDADGLLYYAMPYIDGETLRDRINRERQLPIEGVLPIVHDLAEALEYAHRRNIVHRDVKPQNILLHAGRAFVTDFGVARAVYEGGTPMTGEGHAVGTPEYMSPEQILGTGELDARSDQYSLACVVYEMLAGEPPFLSRSMQSTLARQVSDTASSIRLRRNTVPVAMDAAVARALAKNVSDRFPSVGEFVTALVHAVDPLATVRFATTGPRTPLPFAAAVRREWRPRLWLSGLTALLIVAVLLTLGAPGSRADGPTRIAVRPVDNLTSVREMTQVADLLTAYIIERLHEAGPLEIMDRNSSIALRDAKLTTAQFADSLGVQYVIESTLENTGDSVHLRAHLANSEGKILAVADAARRMNDLRRSGARDSLTSEIVAPLLRALPTPIVLAARRRHDHAIGHEQVINGERHRGRRTFEGLRVAVWSFDSARTMNPEYAEAFAELSKTYGLALQYRYAMGVDDYTMAGIALAAADRAIGLEPDLASGFAARGYVERLTLFPVARVAASFDTARVLDPDAADAVAWSSLVLSLQGRMDEALTQAQRGILVDQLSASRRITYAVVSVSAGRFDDAARSAEVAIAYEPSLALPRAWWARALVLGGRGSECAGMNPGPHAGLQAMCLRAAGRTAEATAIIDSLIRSVSASRGDTMFTDVIRFEDLATYYAFGGDAKAASMWVERAWDRSPNGVTPDLLESALFAPVRSNPTFRAAVDRARRKAADRVHGAKAAAIRRLSG